MAPSALASLDDLDEMVAEPKTKPLAYSRGSCTRGLTDETSRRVAVALYCALVARDLARQRRRARETGRCGFGFAKKYQ